MWQNFYRTRSLPVTQPTVSKHNDNENSHNRNNGEIIIIIIIIIIVLSASAEHIRSGKVTVHR